MTKTTVIEKIKLAHSDMQYASLIECELRSLKSLILEDAVRSACIMTYARPFTISTDKDGKCKKWLSEYDDEIEKYLRDNSPRMLEVHKAIIDERNQLVSHSDNKHHRVKDGRCRHSFCFTSYTHEEFNRVNILMIKYFEKKVQSNEKI